MPVKDYNTDPDLNTQISGINIAEGCAPSGINNAIRQLMADVKEDSEAREESFIENKNPIATGTTTPRSLQDRFADIVNVKDFGAKGDGVADDTASIQAAVDAAVDAGRREDGGSIGKVIWFPEGQYRVTQPIRAWRLSPKKNIEPHLTRVDLTFAGSTQYSTQIIVDFFDDDASQSVIDCTRPAGIGADRRCAPTSFRDISFAMHSDATAHPVYVDIYGSGESRIEHVRFGSSNNTHIRCADAQNLRGNDLVSFYGGKAWKYKTSLQETIILDANSVTTTTETFTASDVGRKFFLTSAENSKTSGFFTVASVESANKVTIAETGYNMTAGRLTWEPARGSMTAGSAVLTANSSCFTASDLGRTVWVRGARALRYGSSFLRGTIIQVNSASAVTLDVAASLSVTDAEFAQPVFDFYSPSALSSGSSDISLRNLHIEHYRGLGFGCENATGWRVEGKIHGETAYYAEPASAAMWLDDFDGVCEMILDSSCAMTGTRVVVCNNNASVLFPNLQTRHNRNECVIEQETINAIEVEEGGDEAKVYSGGGSTVVNNCVVLSKSSDLNILFNDKNDTPKLFITGIVSFAGSSNPRNYLGKSAYFTKGEGLVVEGPVKANRYTTTGGVVTYGDIVANNSSIACSSPNGDYKAQWAVSNNGNISMSVGDITRFSSTPNGFTISSPNGAYAGRVATTNDAVLTFYVGNTQRFASSRTLFTPGEDNKASLGSSSLRWSVIFSASDIINTSDAREKTSVSAPDEALMRAWGKVNFKEFRFVDAVEKKGEEARVHFGVIAQQVAEAFASEGLDASRYALFCFDKWDDEYEDVEVVDVEAVLDEHGNEVTPAKTHTEKRLVTPAGDRYGIRYSEALALECAYQRWRLDKLEAKLNG